jgi:small subunit ribosomal protein S16
MGKKKQPSYRIVVADSRMPRDGRYIESLGYYNPMSEPSTIELNDERALYWLGQGAQPSRQVQNLMKIKGVWEQFQSSAKSPEG